MLKKRITAGILRMNIGDCHMHLSMLCQYNLLRIQEGGCNGKK